MKLARPVLQLIPTSFDPVPGLLATCSSPALLYLRLKPIRRNSRIYLSKSAECWLTIPRARAFTGLTGRQTRRRVSSRLRPPPEAGFSKFHPALNHDTNACNTSCLCRDWRSMQFHPVSPNLIAHKVSDEVVAAYRRTTFFDLRKRMMENWADYCARPSRSVDTIVAFRAQS